MPAYGLLSENETIKNVDILSCINVFFLPLFRKYVRYPPHRIVPVIVYIYVSFKRYSKISGTKSATNANCTYFYISYVKCQKIE